MRPQGSLSLSLSLSQVLQDYLLYFQRNSISLILTSAVSFWPVQIVFFSST